MIGTDRRRTSGARRGLALAAALLVGGSLLAGPAPGQAQTAPAPGPAGGQASGLQVVGHTDLGGEGLNGEVAVVGTTAVVATGYIPMNTMQTANTLRAAINIAPPCETVPVKVVDLSDPARPRVAATIPTPQFQAASDVDALQVSTPAFTGDLVAISYASCQYSRDAFQQFGIVQVGSYADRGIAYYDVTDPSRPRPASRPARTAGPRVGSSSAWPSSPSACSPSAPASSSPSGSGRGHAADRRFARLVSQRGALRGAPFAPRHPPPRCASHLGPGNTVPNHCAGPARGVRCRGGRSLPWTASAMLPSEASSADFSRRDNHTWRDAA